MQNYRREFIWSFCLSDSKNFILKTHRTWRCIRSQEQLKTATDDMQKRTPHPLEFYTVAVLVYFRKSIRMFLRSIITFLSMLLQLILKRTKSFISLEWLLFSLLMFLCDESIPRWLKPELKSKLLLFDLTLLSCSILNRRLFLFDFQVFML